MASKSAEERRMITASASVLLVADVAVAAEYYRDRLGFAFERFWGDPPCFCMVWRDDFCIMLSQLEEPEGWRPISSVQPNVWDAYFWVRDVDGLFRELGERGAEIVALPEDQSYAVREGQVRDPDGHRIAFGQLLD